VHHHTADTSNNNNNNNNNNTNNNSNAAVGGGAPNSSMYIPNVDSMPLPSAFQNFQPHMTSNAEALSIIPAVSETGAQYADITEYLNLPQAEAAVKLGIPASTLSKRWKEAARNRKWPWRTVCAILLCATTTTSNI
jgi:predicted DNA-binding protein (UPF0251 family)